MVVHVDYTHEFGSSKISAFAFVFGLINQTSDMSEDMPERMSKDRPERMSENMSQVYVHT